MLCLAASATPPQLKFAYFYKPPQDHTSAEFLAHHFQLILLSHGDEAYLAQLRRAGYRGPVLQTVAANEAEGPGPYVNGKAPCDAHYPTYRRTVADRVGVFCKQINPHEDWFLHNDKGERLFTRYQSDNGVWRTTYEMDPGSAGWRKFVIARLEQYRKLGYDGFFFDNVDLSLAGLRQQPTLHGGVKEYGSDAAFRHAVAGYLAAIRTAFPKLPLWANLTHDLETVGGWNAYLPSLNGVMVEDFALGWRDYPLQPPARAAQVSNIRAALAAGKNVLLVTQGARTDEARRRFTLALAWALVAAGQGQVYFRYNDSGTWDYRQVWWSPLYALTPPAAAGSVEQHGAVVSRPYPGGTLRLDLGTAAASLPPQWQTLWAEGGHR